MEKEERRKNSSEPFCPNHSKLYRAREGDIIICVKYGCTWSAPARRKEDKDVPTIGDLKRLYE